MKKLLMPFVLAMMVLGLCATASAQDTMEMCKEAVKAANESGLGDISDADEYCGKEEAQQVNWQCVIDAMKDSGVQTDWNMAINTCT